MKNLHIILLALLFPVILILPACQQAPVEPADLVIINANILTIDKDQPKADAIAIKGEWILKLGTNKQIDKYIDEATEIIDAQGRLVFPGFRYTVRLSKYQS